MERFKFVLGKMNPVQFLGGVGRYDVFYSAEKDILYLKYDSMSGRLWKYSYASDRWFSGYNAQRVFEPTDEEKEIALAMATCFAIRPAPQP